MSILYAPSIIKPSRTLITPDTCVNYKHPLADKIVIYNPCLPPNAWIDCAAPYNNLLVPNVDNYNGFQKTNIADALSSNSYYGYVQYYTPEQRLSTDSFSTLLVFATGGTTLTRSGFGSNTAGVLLSGLGFDSSGYLIAGASDGVGTNLIVTNPTLNSSNKFYTAVATYKKGDYLRLYVDGVEVGTPAAATVSLYPAATKTLGHNNAGYTSQSRCSYRLGIYWDGRALTPEEIIDITADPYQVLEPPKTLFYFTGGGGSTTSVYSDTTLLFDVSETITSDSTIKYDIYNIIYSDNSYKYDINNIIYNDSSYKYDILNVISSDSTVKWDIFQNITSDLTSLWDMSGTVSSDSTLKWDMAGKIESDCTFLYDIETEEQVGFFVKQTRRDKASKYNRRKSNSMRYYVR